MPGSRVDEILEDEDPGCAIEVAWVTSGTSMYCHCSGLWRSTTDIWKIKSSELDYRLARDLELADACIMSNDRGRTKESDSNGS